jgi:hypothetical protein
VPLTAYQEEIARLREAGHRVAADMLLSGYVRGTVSHETASTKVEWARDSAWRFMPTIRSDVACTCCTRWIWRSTSCWRWRAATRRARHSRSARARAVGGGAMLGRRREGPRLHAALLEILRRRGKYHPDDFARLRLQHPIDLPAMKTRWLAALADAEAFVRGRPANEIGCLYYSPSLQRFVTPGEDSPGDVVPHFGGPGGVLPRVLE